ncbi:trna (guanine-n2)-methyltransferase homolog [Stylonychia lemnae]|uniref:Trna (Guanine-n2)-methyltransferase homolog n=1 Tax=Stylonychia lemnae TaxID=5949 RepID=A0A077ZWX2_STYLE|nr:trna (guanine-n2)-methyltransferase homolog [Stylonychia lemnae]|eukprot:CDW74335.1 trna (guanine-n2)-methyltransferase homolog [Stylonychia lemnae]
MECQADIKIQSESKGSLYLVHFIKKYKYLDFVLNELESIAEIFGVSKENLYQQSRDSINIHKNPLVFGQGDSIESMLQNLKKDKLYALLEQRKPLKFDVEILGKTISTKEKVEIIERFGFLPFDPKIDLKNPEIIFKVLQNTKDDQWYFGLQIASNREERETFFHKYHLRTRPYLGPTSTETQLAFLMANQGQVKEGDFVYDPFVGTGSIALACSHFNCIQYGSDLDYRVLHGIGVGRKNENVKNDLLDSINPQYDIFTNFDYYQLRRPEILVMDIANLALNHQNSGPIFDSIICDPPYGVRAKSKKVGISKSKQQKYEDRVNARKQQQQENQDLDMIAQENQEIEEVEAQEHITMMEQYDVQKLYYDLLEHASHLLKKGGRIVYLFHTDTSLPEEKNKFPEHPDFEFICSSENNLTKCRARQLITMRRKL